MRTVDAGGLRIAYRRAGSGPPLVLLHGILGDSRLWEPQLEGLADSFDVIAWDTPGCGGSDDPPESSSAADFARLLDGFMEAVGVESAHVGGVSWGGGLAQELYARHPARVESLLLADTYAGWRGSLPAEVCEERLAGCLRESELPAQEFVPAWIPGLVTARAPAELRDRLVAVMSDFHPSGYRAMAVAFAAQDTRELLPAIRVPTLLVWGDADARSPLAVASQMHSAIPGAELVVIPGAGHVSNLEQPERFNAIARDWLRRVTARRPGRASV